LNKVFEVGIDEVGRGAIFGPVFAAAVVLTEKNKLILKQLGVTDIVSVSAVGSLKEDLPPGKFVIVDQFIDRTFARNKTFFESLLEYFQTLRFCLLENSTLLN